MVLEPLTSAMPDVTEMMTDERQMRGGENGKQGLDTRVCCVQASKGDKKRCEVGNQRDIIMMMMVMVRKRMKRRGRQPPVQASTATKQSDEKKEREREKKVLHNHSLE